VTDEAGAGNAEAEREIARRIAYRYFDQPFDGDPETLIRIIEEEIIDGHQNTDSLG
jgi:hypothetical protein